MGLSIAAYLHVHLFAYANKFAPFFPGKSHVGRGGVPFLRHPGPPRPPQFWRGGPIFESFSRFSEFRQRGGDVPNAGFSLSGAKKLGQTSVSKICLFLGGHVTVLLDECRAGKCTQQPKWLWEGGGVWDPHFSGCACVRGLVSGT